VHGAADGFTVQVEVLDKRGLQQQPKSSVGLRERESLLNCSSQVTYLPGTSWANDKLGIFSHHRLIGFTVAVFLSSYSYVMQNFLEFAKIKIIINYPLSATHRSTCSLSHTCSWPCCIHWLLC
jgi:hypothetical protein